jgi:hypothetical protein
VLPVTGPAEHGCELALKRLENALPIRGWVDHRSPTYTAQVSMHVVNACHAPRIAILARALRQTDAVLSAVWRVPHVRRAQTFQRLGMTFPSYVLL